MKTCAQAAEYFGQLAVSGYKNNLAPVLDMIGHAVKVEVEKEIGEYQGAIGSYGATAPLAEATLERKGRYGFGKGGEADTPLYETGAFHNSIEVAKDIALLAVEIGSDIPYVVYSELGTRNEPPRPVFGPATLRAIPSLLPEISIAAGLGLAGGIWKGLAVDAITHAAGNDTADLQP